MFEGWDNFYLLIGSAAGALIGLLFVVATLTGNLGRDKALRGSKIYLTPTVFHFAVVLSVSALTAVPRLGERPAAIALSLVAALGLIYAIDICRMLHRRQTPEPPHWTDIWCYGVAPGGLYLVLAAAAAMLAAGVTAAPDAIGGLLVALLLLAIRNAWDLVTWIAPMANAKD